MVGYTNLVVGLMFILVGTGCVAFQSLKEPPSELTSAQLLPEEADFHNQEKNGSNERPQYCLALSGGGMRSASYSAGVMSAMFAHDVSGEVSLDEIDYISSVSGGGYASGYYYIQKYADESLGVFSKEELLRLQNKLGDRGDLNKYLFILPYLGSFSTVGVFNSLRGHPGQSLIGMAYESSIADSYLGVSPVTTLRELSQFVRQAGLPKFIFNASVYGDNKKKTQRRDRVYEFAMYHEGSRATGFVKLDTFRKTDDDNSKDITIAEVITTSAAGTDAPLTGFWSSVRAAIGGYTGHFEERSGGKSPEYLHFADGGYSENLGAYALIKRGCRHLIIVDAEEDREYVFEGYRILKHDILSAKSKAGEMSVPDIEIEQIEKVLQTNWKNCGDKNDECNAYRDGDTDYYWTVPVMTGAGRFCEGDDCTFSVTYLKLSFDQSRIHEQPELDRARWARLPKEVVEPTPQTCSMSNFYRADSEDEKKLIGTMKKETTIGNNLETTPPHYSTVNQFLSRDQREMLFRLGRAHMRMAICSGVLSK